MASRVVGIESRKLTLANGEWLLVKDRLTAGERNEGLNRMYKRNPDGSYVVTLKGLVFEPARSTLATMTGYLIDWNLTDPQGKPIEIRGQGIDVLEAALNSLDTDSYDEIAAAVNAHEAAMLVARAAQKKILSDASGSAPNSPSPEVAAGPSTTSDR